MAPERGSVLARLTGIAAAIEDALLVFILAGMVVLAGVQIVLREAFAKGLLWADPSLRVMVLWVGMLGAMVATRFDKQISVDVVSRFLGARWRAGVRVLTDGFAAAVAAAVAWSAVRLVLTDRAGGFEAFASVPVWVCELVLPVAFGVISVRYLLHGLGHVREALRGGDR